jgi:hypothetical protein
MVLSLSHPSLAIQQTENNHTGEAGGWVEKGRGWYHINFKCWRFETTNILNGPDEREGQDN